jgi:hypothetical protein
MHGRLDVVQVLLEAGADVDQYWIDAANPIDDGGGCSPVYVASQNGFADVVGRALHSSTFQLNLSRF